MLSHYILEDMTYNNQTLDSTVLDELKSIAAFLFV